MFCVVECESAFVLFSHFYMGNKMNLINTVTCGGFCMMNSLFYTRNSSLSCQHHVPVMVSLLQLENYITICVFAILDLLKPTPLLPEKAVCDVFFVLCYKLKIVQIIFFENGNSCWFW